MRTCFGTHGDCFLGTSKSHFYFTSMKMKQDAYKQLHHLGKKKMSCVISMVQSCKTHVFVFCSLVFFSFVFVALS